MKCLYHFTFVGTAFFQQPFDNGPRLFGRYRRECDLRFHWPEFLVKVQKSQKMCSAEVMHSSRKVPTQLLHRVRITVNFFINSSRVVSEIGMGASNLPICKLAIMIVVALYE